jgi:hypothetical protein
MSKLCVGNISPFGFLLFLLGAVGCGAGVSPATSPAGAVLTTINGHVHGGEQPVVGASIQLYAAGTPASGGGYGQGSMPLITGTLPVSDSNGDFSITGKYTLPAATSYLYIVATGGSSGAGNPVNSHIALMAVISNCTGSSSSAPLLSSLFINVDEVTTMAAVMAMSGYIAAPAPGNAGKPAMGAPSTAVSGLLNALETTSNLANSSTGTVVLPVNNWATSTNNGLMINSMADVLVYCINSNPTLTNNCATLFADATPSSATYTATDTIQAAMYMALNPTNNVPTLFGLIPSSPPFVGLGAAPASWSVSVATSPSACQVAVPLLSVANFVVLASTTITNTGATVISGGNLGLSPGTALTGFPPGTFVSPAAKSIDTTAAAQAERDASTDYTYATALANGVALPIDMSGLTFTPGLYTNSVAETLNSGNVTLDAQGNPNAVFIFQIGTTLTTIGNTQVVLAGGAQAKNVFWAVGTAATLGTNSTFRGNLLAFQSITMTTGATMIGRAVALNAAVTMDTNVATAP